ncbi:MAG: hypothetical protein E6G68_08940 [Actinobacteria bacterium]|nr:MAG: hypothetical protein E6G68_08940 [Actinomycetota bacterium]
MTVVTPFMSHRDESTAIDRGLDGGHFFGYSLGHYYVFGDHKPGRTNVWDEFQQNRSLYGFDRDVASQTEVPLAQQLFQQALGSARGAVGTPDQIREFLRGYKDAGVDQVVFCSQAGRNRHEDICESLELFAKEVMPEFAEDAGEHEQAKLERLGPAPDDYFVRAALQA